MEDIAEIVIEENKHTETDENAENVANFERLQCSEVREFLLNANSEVKRVPCMKPSAASI